MPFEIERFGGSGTVSGFRIRLRGHFCFKEGLDIWQSCHPSRVRSQLYYLDLAEVTELPEDAVAWLSLFLRWAEEAGVSVRLVNAAAEHVQWLGAVGITEDGTAIGNERPGRLRKVYDLSKSASAMDLGDVTLEQIAVAYQRDRTGDANVG
jgi:hypothetical protein